jgi:hypothetical protein
MIKPLRQLSVAVAMAVTLLLGSLRAEPPAETERHTWEWISYPAVSVPGMEVPLEIRVGHGIHDSESHLRLWLSYGIDSRFEDRNPAGIPDPGKIVVRLHLEGGKVVTAATDRVQNWEGIGNSLGTTCSLFYYFPWDANKLEEGWIELRLSTQTFWIEIPYGFTRNAGDPLLPDPEHGIPVLPPAMKKLPAKDLLVPWLFVDYDLGGSSHRWHLTMRMSNPFTGRAEVVLHRDHGRWDLHTQRTAMEVQWPGGAITASAMGVRLTGSSERTDDYRLGMGTGEDQGRLWGKVIVKLEDESYECVVPSSMFKYVHGFADRDNRQRLPRPEPPDGWP